MAGSKHDDASQKFYTFIAKRSTDDELLEHLECARICAELIPLPDPSRLEAGIAELECEVARRRLHIPDGVHEPMPPEVAMRIFECAVAMADYDRLNRALPYLDNGGVWKAFCCVRASDDVRLRTYCLERLLFLLESRVFTSEFASARRSAIRTLGLEHADYESFVEYCIFSVFGTMLL
jgi:hypothetical protein